MQTNNVLAYDGEDPNTTNKSITNQLYLLQNLQSLLLSIGYSLDVLNGWQMSTRELGFDLGGQEIVTWAKIND